MRCSIERRKSGRWSVRYSYMSGDGRRRFRRVTLDAGTRRDAEAAAARIAADMSRSTHFEPARLTVGELCDEWLCEATTQLAPSTVSRYKSIVEHHLKPSLGSLRLRDLSRRDIARAVNHWQTGPRLDKRKGTLSGTSVRHHFTTLSTILHHAVRCGYLATNPCQNVKTPPRTTDEAKQLSLEALRLLIIHADPNMAAAIIVAVGSGLRRGELLGLQWDDVSLDDGLLQVRQSLAIANGGLILKTPKTKKSVRTIALAPFIVAALRAYDVRQSQRYQLFGLAKDGNTPVFDWIGERWHPTNFSSMFYRLRARVGITCRFHDLRHAFASTLLQQHIDLKVTSHLLGHASIMTTADIYSHVVQEQAKEAALAVQSAFSGLRPTSISPDVAELGNSG